MKRRNFIVLIGSVAVLWPVAASAQQSERMRRIGLLTGLASFCRQLKSFSNFHRELAKGRTAVADAGC